MDILRASWKVYAPHRISWIAQLAVCWKCMLTDPVALTRQLVDIESISDNEAAVGHFLSRYLREQGFQVETTPVPQSAGRERFNVYAGISNEPPDVVLSTHMDTVPPFFPSREDDQYIYGRGSCDAKGIIAAQIVAAERLRAMGVRVGLLFLVGEEHGSHGAKVANMKPKGSRFLINGEPTDNRAGPGIERRVERGDSRSRKNGALGLPGVGRLRDP